MTDMQARVDRLDAMIADDHGIENLKGPLGPNWNVFLLPRRENRYGRDCACEVRSCSYPSKCKPGHGPLYGAKP